jgi:hypothetical protein
MCNKTEGPQAVPSSTESTPPASRINSESDLNALEAKKTLKDRSRIPFTTYLTIFLVLGAQLSGGIYSRQVFDSYVNSWKKSGRTTWLYLEYLRDLMQKVASGEAKDWKEILTAAITTLCVGMILYVLIYVPVRAGMWTGTRARRHRIHRYMGLAFLLQYFCAWIEFINHYQDGGKDSYLPQFIALNGRSLGQVNCSKSVHDRLTNCFLTDRSHSRLVGLLFLQGFT